MTALLERHGELDALQRTLSAAARGHGAMAVVLGQPGVGKTRLLESARTLGEQAGLRVVEGRGAVLESSFPFGVVRQLLEQVVTDLDMEGRDAAFDGPAHLARSLFEYPVVRQGYASGDAERFAAVHGLYWLVVNLASARPIALVVDDAHWADEPSLRFVDYLGRRTAGLSLAVIVAARSGEAGATEERLLALEGVGAALVQPRPLTRRAVIRLVREALATEPEEGFADACLHATGGNPLFVVELLRELVARGVQPTNDFASLVGTVGPSAVARLTLARLERLGRDARELASALAVLGDGTDLALAAEATAMNAERARAAADRLWIAGILAREHRLAFAQPIVRAAIYEQLPPGPRAAHHAAAAARLARIGAPPERTAAHLLRTSAAEDPARVATLVTAARIALGRGAPKSALAYLRRALEEPPRAADRPELVLELGRIEHDLQEYGEAEEHLRGAFESHSVRIRADAARWLARTLMSTGRPHETTVPELDDTVDELTEEAPDLALELESELLLAARWAPQDEPGVGARLARFEQRVMGIPRARALAGFHRALARLTAGATSEEVGDRITAALSAGAMDPLEPSYGWAIWCALHSEREDLGLAMVEPALRRARDLGRTSQLALLLAQRAHLVYARGAVADALADAELGLRAVEGFHPALPLLHAVRIDALRERGELDEAEAGLRRAGFADGVGDGPPFGWLLASRCRLRLAQGRLPEALDDFERCERLHDRLGAGEIVHPDWRAYGALALAGVGERAQAQRVAGRQLELARRFGALRGIGTALRAAALAAGDQAGLVWLEEAVQVLEASPARLVLAQVLSDQGALLRALGRRKESREPLRRAIAIAGDCGAPALALRAYAEQRAGGGRPPPMETQGLGALTPAERRVVALAARGESNREIAHTLFVTEKTVEVHLTRAYRKLDIHSRWQLREFGAALSPAWSA